MRLRGLLLCLVATPALAQDQLIPRELVEGLLASRGMRQPVIFVGELPREMVGRVYIPKGARILGGMSMGSGGMAILLSNARREAIIAELESELPKLGWRQFDPSMRVSNPYSEFRDAPIPQGVTRISLAGPQQFCGPSGGMTVNLEPAGFADTRITITANDVNMCGAMRASSSASLAVERAAELAMRPTFINPPAARNDLGNCYRTNDGFNWTSGGGTMLSSSLSPQALLDHYARQMADSGWTPVDVVKTHGAWTRNDSTGKKMQYTMTIEAPANNPNCRRIETQFQKNSGARSP